ncbi:DUF2996 domain-containing protein [Laspinema olomoucense]|uniref:DUF2996 domain-containing protein n=1 Tax=Laspinema olomoucense TaxID=3231600 RepID=UPI0021BB5C3E|nr:DUF2996 domain-containing protein [Laspinema sp. D3d]MCT7975802.1 DUF2996 domain-containing protein [Laspinema sp. D3d]
MSPDQPNSEEASKNPTTPPPNPTAGESVTPPASKQQAPSIDEPQATDMPTANTPDPASANPQENPNAAAEPKAKQPAGKGGAAKPPGKAAKAKDGEPEAAGAKKAKAPAVEDKPFVEFIEQDYIPALKAALAQKGIEDLQIAWSKQKVTMPGFTSDETWAQVKGDWLGSQRHFRVYFPTEDIKGPRAFSCFEQVSQPSTLEPFLIDERKIDLDGLVFYVVQRLTAQKWLTRN